jgi:hypothetical protein
MRRRIVVLVTLALVTAAMMASSLPASAEPISEMSCERIGREAAQAALNWNFERVEALDRAAERKGCDASGRGNDSIEIIV